MSIEKTIYDKRNLERLNGNVIKLPVHDEWWKIKEKLEEETNGDDESKKIKKEDFISYSMSQEDQPFSQGGLVSLLRLNRS